jgi:hypothetical protein
MAKMDAKTYIGVSPEAFSLIVRNARAVGIYINPIARGFMTKNGYMFSWFYDADANILTIHCIHKPREVPESFISARMDDLVASSISAESSMSSLAPGPA